MFYCGSYSFLKEKLENHIQKIPYREKIVFIVHTNKMKLYLKEYLTKRLGILVNAEFYTPIDISKKITNIEPLQDFDKEIILKKFLYDRGYYLDGLPKEISSLIQQIKEFEIPLENLKIDTVKEIIELYENFKYKNGYYDREDVHKAALEKNIYFDNVFIFGIKSVPNLYQRLFTHIKKNSKRFFVFLPVIVESGVYENYDHLKDILRFWERLVGVPVIEKIQDENLKLAREIYRFDYGSKRINPSLHIKKAKNEYEEVEIVSQKIAELLENNVRPYEIGVVIPQLEKYTPFLKEILSKYKIPYTLIEESRFIDEPVFKKLFSIFKVKEENFSKDSVIRILSDILFPSDDISELEEKIILSPVREGFSDWENLFFSKNSENTLYKLLYTISLIPDRANIEVFIKAFEDINSTFTKHKKAKIFLDNTLETLRKTTLYKKLFREISYTEFVKIVETFFYQENKEQKKKGNFVSILTPISAEANNFKYIFFLNLNSGDFPDVYKQEILATSEELDGINYPYYLLMQQILNFTNLLDKNKEIYLSFIQSSVNSSEKAPSVIVEEICRILNVEEIPVSKPSKEATLKDFLVHNAVSIAVLDKTLKEKYNRIKNLDRVSKEDYRFKSVKLDFPVKATDFQVYAYCPYKFYLEKVIGIEEIEEVDRTKISPVDTGVIVHELLESFYKKLYKKPLIENLKELEKNFWEKVNQKLLYVVPSYRPFEERKMEVLFMNLREFIMYDLKRLKKDNKKPELLEKLYKNELFIGRIDRVDVDRKKNYYIYDYKTSDAPQNIKEDIKHKYIQLVIYKEFLEKDGKTVKEVGIFAIRDSGGQYLYSIGSEEFFNLKKHLLNLTEELKNKSFYPKKNDQCNWCQFKDFCLVDKLEE